MFLEVHDHDVYPFPGDDRLNRSTHQRTTRDASSNTVSYKYLEAALIVPKSYEEKYGNKFQTILLVIANMVRIRTCMDNCWC